MRRKSFCLTCVGWMMCDERETLHNAIRETVIAWEEYGGNIERMLKARLYGFRLPVVSAPTKDYGTLLEWARETAGPKSSGIHELADAVDDLLSRLPVVPVSDNERKIVPESLESQIERLATFIMDNVPGEPSQSEGAVDTAIRLLSVVPVPVYEYGVLLPEIRTEPSFVGVEDSARYFMGCPANLLDKYARDDDKRVLVRAPKRVWELCDDTH